ncbi:MAG: arsenate reductase ArsC [Planctomycetaceae bacterium]|nr:arsenate reductase ArsC [Planctomycetaceae bacterium]
MDKPLVLFICTGNSARSQMAEAFLRRLAGDRFDSQSAGRDPRPIHPMTVRVMEEVGISLETHRPKSIREFLGRESVRHAIFVCAQAEEQCPAIWPYSRSSMSWPFDDPAAVEGSDEEKLQKFREVRDAIRTRITLWLESQPRS